VSDPQPTPNLGAIPMGGRLFVFHRLTRLRRMGAPQTTWVAAFSIAEAHRETWSMSH